MSIISRKCQEGTFVNYVSLGRCCHIALDLEKLGMRSFSLPFDWIQSKWYSVEYAIKNNFSNFLVYEDLYQYKNHKYIYESKEHVFVFPHDFTSYKSLKSQYNAVKQKYDRRISKFYKCVKSPTLFIRYIWDIEEQNTFINRYDEIVSLLKEYNPENELILITHYTDETNTETLPDKDHWFFVQKDKNNSICTNPIIKCPQLNEILSNAVFPDRDANLSFYHEKYNPAKKITLQQKFHRKISKIQKKFCKEYTHDKVI